MKIIYKCKYNEGATMRPGHKGYTVQVPTELYERMQRAAAEDNRSLNRWMLEAFKDRCNRQEQDSITRPWIPSGLKRING